jgi:hypothetical protein
MSNTLRISQEGLKITTPASELVKPFEKPLLNASSTNNKENICHNNSSTEISSETDKKNTSKPILLPSSVSEEQSVMMEADSHHPQMIDEDVETFTQKLDTLIANFRGESLKEFMKTKRHILNEQARCIENEQNRCSALVSSKQDELERVKEELVTTQGKFNRITIQMDRLTNYCMKYNKRSRVFLFKFVNGWREIKRRNLHNKQVKPKDFSKEFRVRLWNGGKSKYRGI